MIVPTSASVIVLGSMTVNHTDVISMLSAELEKVLGTAIVKNISEEMDRIVIEVRILCHVAQRR